MFAVKLGQHFLKVMIGIEIPHFLLVILADLRRERLETVAYGRIWQWDPSGRPAQAFQLTVLIRQVRRFTANRRKAVYVLSNETPLVTLNAAS